MKEKIKVLIAEDEANLGTILDSFLTGRGYAGTYLRGTPNLDAGVVAYGAGSLVGCVFHER